MEQIFAYAAVDRVINASLFDLRNNIIPKFDCVPVFLAGVLLHWLQGGWAGAITSILAAISFFTFIMSLAALPSVILGPGAYKSLGGGDAKLALACGAFFGWEHLWILFVSYALITSIFDLLSFLNSVQNKNPVSIIKETLREFKAELYCCGKEECRAYAPFIAVPFIVALIIKFYLFA